jgi:ATP-dependent 26S proteasome regulatory subunit
MESYKGFAVLTTNMKSALDQAFLRRLRFVIEFPFPDAPARRRIWEGMFPREAPTRKLDLTKLSHLNISGGNIRNIVLGAAFNAAEEGVAIGMQHVFEAAKREYRKLDKSLQSRETRGWE